MFFIATLPLRKQKEEIEAQRDEIESQRDEIERQHHIAIERKTKIESQKKDITDSIEYAKRIQDALFPDKISFKKVLTNVHHEDIPFQKKLLHQSFHDWKGSTEQIDDVLVLGFRV